jgi:hypothetical protein
MKTNDQFCQAEIASVAMFTVEILVTLEEAYF